MAKCPNCDSEELNFRLDNKCENGSYTMWVECEECNFGSDYNTHDGSLDELLEDDK